MGTVPFFSVKVRAPPAMDDRRPGMYSRLFVMDIIKERQAELRREARIARSYPTTSRSGRKGSILRSLTMLLMRSS